jgi:hypothetical protein
MIEPGRYDIAADRWVACIRTFTFRGVDFTGATFAAQVRVLPDAGGSPLVNLATVGSLAAEGISLIYGGTDTITNHITAGRLLEVPDGYVAGDSLALSEVGFRINETTMEGLPMPPSEDSGDAMPLAWDMHITPSGGIKDKYLGGTFTVRAGVTQ